MKIGDEVYVHGYVDEIRKDVVIIRNEGGYFGTIKEEINLQPTCNLSSNLISRQALCEYALNQKDKSVTPNDIMRFPSVQPVDKDTNVPSKDTIYRQDAIDACIRVQEHHAYDEIEEIKALPSAQPEPCEDVVSRQAVYNVLDKMPVRGFKKDGETIHGLISLSQVNSAIIDLPSAQPELLTDKEQRIFLAAMGREEEVCKEVDDAWRDCREPYEDSLMRVCKEIRRKVKGALWT